MKWIKLADLYKDTDAIKSGVSAPFTGIINNKLIVAGGCNFPEKPVTEGGMKRYYDEIFMLDLTNGSNQWKSVGKLPYTVAYGASVSIPGGIICIGGNNKNTSFSEVLLLTWDEENNKVDCKELPALHKPMDNLSATVADHMIYVAGGNRDGQPCNSFFRLNLSNIRNQWEELPDFPGAARVQPVLAAQKNTEGTCIYLAGGFQPAQGEQKPIVPTSILRYNPSTRMWKEETTLPHLENRSPRTLTGGCALAYGDSIILWVGGVNHNRFYQAIDRPGQIKLAQESNNITLLDSLIKEANEYMYHPVEWYNFNSSLLIYDTFRKQWNNLGEYEQLARAGAGAVIYKNQLIIVNGELKPGIRTSSVNMVYLSGI